MTKRVAVERKRYRQRQLTKQLSVAVAAVALVGNLAAQEQAPPPPAQPQLKTPVWNAEAQEHKRRVRDAREKEGLRAAAKLDGGGYIDYVDFDYELRIDSIDILVDSARLVVRGIVKKNRCLLVHANVGYPEPVETIVTDYTIQVFDVYKGDPLLHSREITVRIPGGRAEFEDGLWAEVQTGFLPPLNQQEFILFLTSHPSEKDVYEPTFNRLGLFEIQPGGWVSPGAQAESALARKTTRDYREFVAELNRIIARQKEAGGNTHASISTAEKPSARPRV